MILFGQLALTFALISLLSVGGINAAIPEIHRQVVDLHHWMDDATFASLVAIGSTAPGPNVIIVSMIGWQVAGLPGLLTASCAILLPSCAVALAAGRVLLRDEADATVALVRHSLAPVAIGFMCASGVVMTRAAFVNPLSLAITALVATQIVLTRVSPVWGIAAGAVVGLVGHRLHVFG